MRTCVTAGLACKLAADVLQRDLAPAARDVEAAAKSTGRGKIRRWPSSSYVRRRRCARAQGAAGSLLGAPSAAGSGAAGSGSSGRSTRAQARSAESRFDVMASDPARQLGCTRRSSTALMLSGPPWRLAALTSRRVASCGRGAG